MKKLILSLVFIVSILSINIYSQIIEEWQGYKISIPFIRVIESKTLYGPSGKTTLVYPPQNNSTKIIGYEFLLEVTISIHSQRNKFNETVPIVFHTPDNKKTIYYFNQEKASLKTNSLFTFTLPVQTKFKGYTEIGFLRKFSDSPELQEVYENGLRLE